MIIISRLDFKPTNIVTYPCQIFYKKDGDITSKNKYKFDNKEGESMLLDGYYLFSNLKKEDYEKVVNIETGKEVYFSDLVKIDPNFPIENNKLKEAENKKLSIWKKIGNQLKGIFL